MLRRLIATVLLATAARTLSGTLSPMLIIPGFGTSKLVATISSAQTTAGCSADLTSAVLWPSLDYAMSTDVANCWLNNIKLIADTTSRLTSDTPGVSVSVDGFGSTETLETLNIGGVGVDYLKSLVTTAVNSWGYVRNVSIRAAPYDFRKSPAEASAYFTQLKELIETMYSDNGDLPISLLAHSFGNHYAVYFLTQIVSASWKKTYLKQYLAIAPLFGGAVESQQALASGWDQFGIGLPWSAMSYLRSAQRTYSSVPVFRPRVGGWSKTETLVFTQFANYTLSDNDTKNFYTTLNLSVTYSFYKALGSNEFLDGSNLNVPINCLMGIGLDSPSALTYASFPPSANPTISNEDGDSVVTLRSANLCLNFSNSTMKTISGLNHITIVSDSSAIAYIKTLLYA